MDNSTNMIDYVYQKEINYQLELVSRLNLANISDKSLPPNEIEKDTLFNLEQSLFKLADNELFIQAFKTNQVK